MAKCRRRKRSSAATFAVAIITLAVVLAGTSCGNKSLKADTVAHLATAQEKAMEACGVPGVISGVWTHEGS
jgi:hypothetical protein